MTKTARTNWTVRGLGSRCATGAIVFGLGMALLVPGLAHAKKPKPYGKVVVTYNQQLAAGCRYIGDVDATSIWGGFMDKVGRRRAKRAIQKKTHRLGGNLAVVAQRPGLQGFVSYGAMAFACPADEEGRPLIEVTAPAPGVSPPPATAAPETAAATGAAQESTDPPARSGPVE